ncbi:hypothetical protein M1O47_03630 [Dehalococcoidia bacterium]|nr:hypothetical protein [Dehalococcoidia bacterium]
MLASVGCSRTNAPGGQGISHYKILSDALAYAPEEQVLHERDDRHLRPIAFKLTKARRHSFVGYFHWLKWLGWVGSIGEDSLAAKGKTTDEGDYGAIDGKGTPTC